MGWRTQPRAANGQWGKKSAGAAAVVTAGALVIGGASGTGAGAGAAVEASGAADSVAARVKQGKEPARKGKSDEAWRKAKLRKVKQEAKNAVNCAVNSYGRVQEYFVQHPCKSLDRTLFTLADPAGGTFVVSVSWLRLHDRDDVRPLEALVTKDGTGSVKSLGFDALRSQGVRFTGTPFDARSDGKLLVVAEGAVVSGKPDPDLVKGAVEIAVELPG
ncbi:hypothetical protein [Actinokineospora sp. NBRC 105648]|uniref:hypothetical protein n=1 Tax=Actinokineospora sp. NBRC 105648 TaxID=3032206 RepID=UPI0024A0E236|nr:hypothetical protein [Actinokineospora sp. NBRC 105648]GLZ39233.1 hypothetical protein Acsp05_28570 [Actinokineospora sp. NBRC 105648]